MNRKMRTSTLRALTLLVTGCLASSVVWAGGPLALRDSGDPYLWPNGGQQIVYNPDQGGFGDLDNPAAVMLIDMGFAEWGAVATSTASYLKGDPLPEDVNGGNFFPYLFPSAPDGLSAIVLDENGAIFDFLFGGGSGVLGFAGPEWVNTVTGEILEGLAFLNGGAFLRGYPYEEAPSLFVHEFGHLTNLAHTVVNGEAGAFGDNYGPTPFDTFPFVVPFDMVETMYPFILVGGGQATLDADDIAILSTLYPAPGYFSSFGTISGTILAPNGLTRVSGVNVIARNVDDPYADAVSAISGDFTDSLSQSDPFTGVYTLNGLTPGANYAVYVDRILLGGFSTPIRSPLPGGEELYNGANESADPDLDDPSMFTGVPSVAGAPTTGIDIIFNRLAPGPIAIGDDDFVELFLPFPFSFCGLDYTSLFVNSNGSISFGAGSRDFSESGAELLDFMPRIAGYWDDLNPAGGGVVSFAQTDNTFTVSWDEVPEFFDTGANSFSIKLFRSSNRVELIYGDLSSDDGVAGFSCGGEVTNRTEPESDLTELAARVDDTINGRNLSALWEQYAGDADLANYSWSFTAPNEFKDLREPNSSLTQATRVKLPFDSGMDFSEIRPQGGDIDFFRFRAEAGQTLLAETVIADAADTLIGLFDWETGELLDVDDDGGEGLLSSIVYPIESDGLYAIAVTTWPDFDFIGDGNSDGRYILQMETILGTLLELGDDDSEEVFFETFMFPYQGMLWESVWVNSNGNLTFGAGDPDFSESVGEFVNESPRIAPLWDDFNPAQGGMITVGRTETSMTVTYSEVPEWPSTGANTFAVTMNADGSVAIEYGMTNGNDGLTGVTEGGGAMAPGSVDLSTMGSWPVVGTTYEQFFLGEFDLDEETLVFSGM